MNDEDAAGPVEVPADALSPEALRGVIEHFVLREGTDYGEREYSLEQKVADVLRQLKGEGMSILLVEHDMDLVMQICDHLVVMEFGTLLTQGPPEQVQQDPKVRAAYLGTEH